MSHTDRAQVPPIVDYFSLRTMSPGLLMQPEGSDCVTRGLVFWGVYDVMVFARSHSESVRKVAT